VRLTEIEGLRLEDPVSDRDPVILLVVVMLAIAVLVVVLEGELVVDSV
jgi:hypothetical protein